MIIKAILAVLGVALGVGTLTAAHRHQKKVCAVCAAAFVLFCIAALIAKMYKVI